MSLDVEALKRLNATLLAVLEEREELRRRLDVASETLADYAAIHRERMAQRERIQHLEAALRQIASCQPHAPGDVVHVTRAALAADPQSPRVLDPQEAWVLDGEEAGDGLG